jgi:hypothetical protein
MQILPLQLSGEQMKHGFEDNIWTKDRYTGITHISFVEKDIYLTYTAKTAT